MLQIFRVWRLPKEKESEREMNETSKKGWRCVITENLPSSHKVLLNSKYCHSSLRWSPEPLLRNPFFFASTNCLMVWWFYQLFFLATTLCFVLLWLLLWNEKDKPEPWELAKILYFGFKQKLTEGKQTSGTNI